MPSWAFNYWNNPESPHPEIRDRRSRLLLPEVHPCSVQEDQLWNGYPEETNAPYGLAKKMLLVQGTAYREQYGFNSIHVVPANLYGPEDNFDPQSSHVIPALIRKCVEARDSGAPFVEVWGTGSASREFLYADNAAEGIMLAASTYDGAEPVNLGTGVEVRINELVIKIAAAVGFDGEIRWDRTKPDGQPRRAVDTTRAAKLFGFRARTTLDEGLASTVAWYEAAARGLGLAR